MSVKLKNTDKTLISYELMSKYMYTIINICVMILISNEAEMIHMNQLKVVNRENQEIIVVTNFNTDTEISANSFAMIDTNSRFGSDGFYVDGDAEGNWTSRMADASTIEIFLKVSEYATGKSQYGDTEAW